MPSDWFFVSEKIFTVICYAYFACCIAVGFYCQKKYITTIACPYCGEYPFVMKSDKEGGVVRKDMKVLPCCHEELDSEIESLFDETAQQTPAFDRDSGSEIKLVRQQETIRERIDKEVRSRTLHLLLSFPALFLGIIPVWIITEYGFPMLPATIIWLVSSFAYIAISKCRARQKWLCPTCSKPQLQYGHLGGNGVRGDMLKMPETYKHCPYCGQNFDEPVRESE